MTSRPHHRPAQRDADFFDDYVGGTDPALVSEAADRAAQLLVRGTREAGDAEVAERLRQVRWMLEEYRVSLWAQQLGTAHPVSDERVRKALAT